MGAAAPDRDLTRLHPVYRAVLADLYDELDRRSLRFRMHEGFRGAARQADGKARGRSKAGWLQSDHNYGLASDFVGDVPGVNPWDKSHDWEGYGLACEAVGLEWSGRWTTFRELVHNSGRGLFAYSRHDIYLGALADVRTEEECDWLGRWLELDDMRHTNTRIACIQRIARRLGGDPGPIDGLWGRQTAAGVDQVLRGFGVELADDELDGEEALSTLLLMVRADVRRVCG